MTAPKIKPRPIKFKISLTSKQIDSEIIDTVNLRELHKKLQNGKQFSDWIKDRIEKYDFIENKDFIVIHQKVNNSKGGRPFVEYFGTLTMAKELAMVENNLIGKAARQYFIQCEKELKEQASQPYMPRGYPQMLEAARNDWKRVRNELITLLGAHFNVFDRKRKSQFTDQIYLDLIETTARRLREHFELTQPNQLTRDYLHQLVQECIVEIEIRLSDGIISGSINSWEEFKDELERITDHIRYMKELQNGRIPLPHYAYPVVNNVARTWH